MINSTPNMDINRKAALREGSNPAIVAAHVIPIDQLALRCANGYRATLAQAETWVSNHKELRQRYKEKWPDWTWDQVCLHVYGVSRQAIDKKLLKLEAEINATEVAEPPLIPETTKDTLLKVAALPDPKDEEVWPDEKPQVVARQPEPTNNGHAELTKDDSGRPIPKHLLAMWERRQEVQDAITMASRLKCLVEEKHTDILYRHLRHDHQDFVSQIQSIHYALSRCKPEVVCPKCRGSGKECDQCRKAGFVTSTDAKEYHRIFG